VQDSTTQTSHQLLAYLFMTSKEFLDSLDADTRAQLIQIADEVTVAANNSVKDKEEANRKNILDAGGKINELTPAQRKQWVDAMKPVWKQFEDEIGSDVIAAAAAS
jgi:C4-dicarboxylate-binding protein DctP